MMQLKYYVKIQLKVFKRYLNLFFSGIIANIVVTIFVIAIAEFRPLINIPFFILIICCFMIGPFLGEIFCGGENEKRSYCLAPWSLRSIIISKSTALVFVILIIPIPLLIINSYFFVLDISDLKNACLYLVTAIPVFLIIGNLVSIFANNKYSEDSSSNTFYQFLMFVISFLPYLIFKVWLQNIVLCLVFCVLSLTAWYIYVVPFVVNQFRKQNYNLQRI